MNSSLENDRYPRISSRCDSENPAENQHQLAPHVASFADTLEAAIAAGALRGFVIAPLSQSVRSLSPNVRQPEWLLSRNLSQRMPLLSRRVD